MVTMFDHDSLLGILVLASLSAVAGCGDAGITQNPTESDGGGADGPATPSGDGATKSDGSSSPDAATGASTCTSGTILTAGKAVPVTSTKNGNPQRDYCILAPPSATTIEISMNGGTCAPYKCTGDDVEITLKLGAVPDAFEPDAKTKQWTYTPGPNGFGTFGKSATGGGAFYVSLIDGANTLGYSGVTMSVSFK